MQSFAEILADELARLEPSEIPPSSAFALPEPSFEHGLSAAFFLAAVAPVMLTCPPAPAPVVLVAPPPVERLLRGFSAQHVEPIIVAMKLDLFEE